MRSHWFTERSLKESFREGECLICSNLAHAGRHAIFSFLWEGMMSPMVRDQFVESGGFCAGRFWEEGCWPAGGIGVAILCENLISRALGALPDAKDFEGRKRGGLFPRKTASFLAPPTLDCMFCRDLAEREESLLETLELLKRKELWKEKLDRSPLCLHHTMLAPNHWESPDCRQLLRSDAEARFRQLRADLNEFIRKHDWNHREEPLGREREAVERAIQLLTGLERQFPQPRKRPEGGNDNGNRRR